MGLKDGCSFIMAQVKDDLARGRQRLIRGPVRNLLVIQSAQLRPDLECKPIDQCRNDGIEGLTRCITGGSFPDVIVIRLYFYDADPFSR